MSNYHNNTTDNSELLADVVSLLQLAETMLYELSSRAEDAQTPLSQKHIISPTGEVWEVTDLDDEWTLLDEAGESAAVEAFFAGAK